MLTAAEIARGMQGAVAFLQRDPAAPSYFDNTAESCLRSFKVMILVAPLYAVIMLMLYANVTTTADSWEIVFVEALRYTVDWLLFPVIFYEIARRQTWLGNYPRYIAALNWVNLPLTIVAMVAVILASILPVAFAILIQLGLYGLLLLRNVLDVFVYGTEFPLSFLFLVQRFLLFVPDLLKRFRVHACSALRTDRKDQGHGKKPS